MPPKEPPQKKKDKRGKKRDVISPLSQVSENTPKTGSDTKNLNSDQSDSVYDSEGNPHKRFHPAVPSPPEYFVFEHPTMSYSQQNYTGQVLQSPQGQYTPQYMSIPPNAQNAQTTTPPWALSLMDDVKGIKIKIDKIDSIEKTVNTISLKITQLETKVDNIDKRVMDVERTCAFINDKYEDQSTKLKSAEGEIKKLHESCGSLRDNMESLEKDRDRLNDKVLDSEFRSMRDNLIFYGVSESTPVDASAAVIENCDALIKTFIKEHLDIDASNMTFDRAHRLGALRGNRTPRPIVVKFHYYNERETIRKDAWPLKDALRRSNCGVGVQLPKEWRDARKTMSDAFQEEKRKGKNVKFVGDKLFVNGQQYKPPTNNAR